mmetsp:Transcript_23506/g.73926  ORF Transcript_23506/g.73926 Transcript_23506/m.73926 type:complete len:281 (+) Transcript_23506:1872-2714(+)
MSPRLSPSLHLARVISTDAHFLATPARSTQYLAQTWKTSSFSPRVWPRAHLSTISLTLSLAPSTKLLWASISRLCRLSRSARSPLMRLSSLLRSAWMLLEVKTSFFQQLQQVCLVPRLEPSSHWCSFICTAWERRILFLASWRSWSHPRSTDARSPRREPFSHFAMMTSRSLFAPLWVCSRHASPSWIFLSALFCTLASSSACRRCRSARAPSRFLASLSTRAQCLHAEKHECARPLSLPSTHCMAMAWMLTAVLRSPCSRAARLRQNRMDSRTRPTASP